MVFPTYRSENRIFFDVVQKMGITRSRDGGFVAVQEEGVRFAREVGAHGEWKRFASRRPFQHTPSHCGGVNVGSNHKGQCVFVSSSAASLSFIFGR